MSEKKGLRDYSETGQWGIANVCADKIEEIIEAGGEGVIEVEMKVNGVEVDFDIIMNEFERQFEILVKEEAKKYVSEIVKNKVADVTEILYNIENQADCLQRDLEETVGF